MTRARTYAVLLLLDLKHGAILEGPLDNIGLLLRLGELAALQGAPKALEVLHCLGPSANRCRGGHGGERRGANVRLMKCQTWLRGALMTALSTTEVEVGMAVEDIIAAFTRSSFFV